MIQLISPAAGAELSILTEVQREFIRRERPMKPWPETHDMSAAYPWLNDELTASLNQSQPASVIFKWKNTEMTAPMKFELSTSPDFAPYDGPGSIATLSDVFSSADEPGVFCVRADNLFSGTSYYWRVTAGDASESSHFSTVYGELRPIRVGGIKNVRDIGGRVNAEGRRVKQGLVYRGLAFDGLVQDPECIGADGLRVARHDLGIKTDLDLRAESVDEYEHSFLGEDVKYLVVPFEAEGATLNDMGRAALRAVLEHFADKDNFPIYYHCAVGADRTGTIGMYLDAILGMATEDLVLNYNFTTLAHSLTRSWYHTPGPVDFFEFLEETYPDATVPERLILNLLKSGISEETLQKIRDNLLE